MLSFSLEKNHEIVKKKSHFIIQSNSVTRGHKVRNMRSSRWKLRSLIFLLYLTVVNFFIASFVRTVKHMYSSKRSKSSLMDCMLSSLGMGLVFLQLSSQISIGLKISILGVLLPWDM